MKSLILFLFFQVSSLNANEIRKDAIIRDNHFNPKIQNIVLSDLISDVSYEGKYFKIVKGKNKEPVRFDESEDLQLKAATTYFHLNKARKFFVEVVKSKYVRDLPQVVVRIDLINVFNEVGHFGNDNLDPQFNNALTVPAGVGYEPKDIKPWGMEIWFRPAKEININDFKGSFDYGPSIKTSLVTFRNQTHMSNLETFLTTLFNGGFGSGVQLNSVMRLVGSSLMIELIYQSSDSLAEFFSRKIYKLNSALVPEIIYHEFSHLALSDHLELSHSTAVNEGLADYFAGKIANSERLATKIKKYNLFNGKQVRKKQQYQIAFERGDYANTDFVFGLLWNVGQTIGVELETKFMFEMTTKLSTNVSIRDDLLNAIFETCKLACKSPLNDRIKLYELLNSKNL